MSAQKKDRLTRIAHTAHPCDPWMNRSLRFHGEPSRMFGKDQQNIFSKNDRSPHLGRYGKERLHRFLRVRQMETDRAVNNGLRKIRVVFKIDAQKVEHAMSVHTDRQVLHMDSPPPYASSLTVLRRIGVQRTVAVLRMERSAGSPLLGVSVEGSLDAVELHPLIVIVADRKPPHRDRVELRARKDLARVRDGVVVHEDVAWRNVVRKGRRERSLNRGRKWGRGRRTDRGAATVRRSPLELGGGGRARKGLDLRDQFRKGRRLRLLRLKARPWIRILRRARARLR